MILNIDILLLLLSSYFNFNLFFYFILFYFVLSYLILSCFLFNLI